MHGSNVARTLLVALAVLIPAGLLSGPSLPAVRAGDSSSSTKPFTGSLTVRQKAGSLYYKVFVLRGSVIGGYDTWKGRATHYYQIVGGWYDSQRMTLLLQSTRNDLGDKWYSHAHQFEKEGNQFILKHTLYGFGKTLATGEVYKPHVIEEIRELHPEEVQRLAASAGAEPATTAASDSREAALKQGLQRLERENTRLKQLVGGLLLEKTELEDRLRKGRPQ
jgi:hypothetical protein